MADLQNSMLVCYPALISQGGAVQPLQSIEHSGVSGADWRLCVSSIPLAEHYLSSLMSCRPIYMVKMQSTLEERQASCGGSNLLNG